MRCTAIYGSSSYKVICDLSILIHQRQLYPTMCRRTASFPIVSEHHPTASLLRIRSHSESDALNQLGLINSRTICVKQLNKHQFTLATFEKSLDKADSISQGEADETLNDNDYLKDNLGDFDHLSVIVQNAIGEKTEVAIRPCKSVRFADDCGKELITVRVMTEPSDCPPTISASVIRRLFGETDETELSHQTSASWAMSFKQPASEYIKFRETLDREFVALENVVLKNEVCHMIGTIKVKNITFEKKIFVRFTSDGWKSFYDRMATYQPSSSKFYDTFSFDVELPSNGSDPNARIEFCICFETGCSQDGSILQQYWDSNAGRNYALTSQVTPPMPPSSLPLLSEKQPNDAYSYEFDDWTKFAAWRSIPNEGPYW